MRLLADRARQELHAAGARPRRAALTGTDSLTPAEHKVAVLAARGHSNPQIAQQLYVTRRTVETHLTHIFQKLDIATRADLTTQLGGVEPAGQLAASGVTLAAGADFEVGIVGDQAAADEKPVDLATQA